MEVTQNRNQMAGKVKNSKMGKISRKGRPQYSL